MANINWPNEEHTGIDGALALDRWASYVRARTRYGKKITVEIEHRDRCAVIYVYPVGMLPSDALELLGIVP